MRLIMAHYSVHFSRYIERKAPGYYCLPTIFKYDHGSRIPSELKAYICNSSN